MMLLFAETACNLPAEIWDFDAGCERTLLCLMWNYASEMSLEEISHSADLPIVVHTKNGLGEDIRDNAGRQKLGSVCFGERITRWCLFIIMCLSVLINERLFSASTESCHPAACSCCSVVSRILLKINSVVYSCLNSNPFHTQAIFLLEKRNSDSTQEESCTGKLLN